MLECRDVSGLVWREAFEFDAAGEACMGIAFDRADCEEIAVFPEQADLEDREGDDGDSAAIIVVTKFF